jgi:hypothetical protein
MIPEIVMEASRCNGGFGNGDGDVKSPVQELCMLGDAATVKEFTVRMLRFGALARSCG